MGDRTSIELRIGGALSQDILASLEDFLDAEGFANGNGQIGTELLDAVAEKRAAVFGDDEAYASIEDSFKAFCREHGLTYRLAWNRCAYYDGGVTLWRPEWEEELTRDTLDDDLAMTVAALINAREAGLSLADVIAGLENFYDDRVPALQFSDAEPALAEQVAS